MILGFNDGSIELWDLLHGATDSKYLLDRLNVYVNDVPIYRVKGIDLRKKNVSTHEQNITLKLSNGKNKIQVSVLNQQRAESLKETFEIIYSSPSTHLHRGGAGAMVISY